MKKRMRFQGFGIAIGVLLFSIACAGFGAAKTSEPKAVVAPLLVGSDLSAVDVCKAIPVEDIEAVMGRKLSSAPEAFNYYDTPGTAGCSYDAGKDSSGNAYFGYVVLTPTSVYSDQPLYKNVDVSGIGEEAYFNNGADARQLWVKVNAELAFVVAFGDRPNEEGAKAIAKLVAAALVSR